MLLINRKGEATVKNSNLYQVGTTPDISTFVDLTTAKMMAWVRGYNTADEAERLKVLAKDIIHKIEYESGARLGRRDFVVEMGHNPHAEVFEVYPVNSITKIEIRNDDGTYSVLNTSKYRFIERHPKQFMILMENGIQAIDESRMDSLKIYFNAGFDETKSLPGQVLQAIRLYVETYFRDKMPSEVKIANETIERAIDNLRLAWL